MPKDTPSVVVLLDDSSDSSGSDLDPLLVAKSLSSSTVVRQAGFSRNVTQRQKTAVKQRGHCLELDSSDDNEDELEVMPPAKKRQKSDESAVKRNHNDSALRGQNAKKTMAPLSAQQTPRLSCSGPTPQDALNLCDSSPSSLETMPLAERLARRRKNQGDSSPLGTQTGAHDGKDSMFSRASLGTVPSVSLSVASGSPEQPSSDEAKVKMTSGRVAASNPSFQNQKDEKIRDSSKQKHWSDSESDHSNDESINSTFKIPFAQKLGNTRTVSNKQTSTDSSSDDEKDGPSFSASRPALPARATHTAKTFPLDRCNDKDQKEYSGTEFARRFETLSSSSSDENKSCGTSLKQKSVARRGPRKLAAASSSLRKSPSSSKKQFNVNSVFTEDSSSSSDDESCTLKKTCIPKAAARKKQSPTNKQKKEAEKAQKRREREEERATKKREKELAKQNRERERQEKREAEAALKQQRKDAREEAGQARGKYASQEVVVLMEPDLVEDEVFNVKEVFSEHGYMLHPYPSALSCLAIQWVRRDYLRGGAEEALKMVHARKDQEYEQMNTLVILFDCPHDFISLIQQDEQTENDALSTHGDDDDDYPKLESWLLGLVAGWRSAWRKTTADRPRIYLILYQVQKALDKAWISYNRSRGGRSRGPPPPNAEQLYDAILWMLIQFQIEVIHCDSKDDVPKELAKITRFLANARYQAQTTELACFQKLKAQVSDMAPSLERAADCWIRQLQQVPRVSAEMARCFARFYPTSRSLWLAYQTPDLSLEEKQVMVANCFGTRTSQIKIAKWMYRIFHSKNPDELLT